MLRPPPVTHFLPFVNARRRVADRGAPPSAFHCDRDRVARPWSGRPQRQGRETTATGFVTRKGASADHSDRDGHVLPLQWTTTATGLANHSYRFGKPQRPGRETTPTGTGSRFRANFTFHILRPQVPCSHPDATSQFPTCVTEVLGPVSRGVRSAFSRCWDHVPEVVTARDQARDALSRTARTTRSDRWHHPMHLPTCVPEVLAPDNAGRATTSRRSSHHAMELFGARDEGAHTSY